MWRCGNGSAGGSRRKSGSEDDKNKLLGAGRMPWWFPCISGPSSVRLSLTVISTLHGLQSNTRLEHGYGRRGVEAAEGGQAKPLSVTVWSLELGP